MSIEEPAQTADAAWHLHGRIISFTPRPQFMAAEFGSAVPMGFGAMPQYNRKDW